MASCAPCLLFWHHAGEERGYAGKVDASLDHRAYMPAAWRVDDYLEGEFLVRVLF